ncbi:MAG: PhnD/SsuA/transferrin family substrate-binding protein [Betaproteobacteria bacterium]|nr:PhnD/SsuA/transferrin family substrate-binding protein [Betaproteobacteria bacterium]
MKSSLIVSIASALLFGLAIPAAAQPKTKPAPTGNGAADRFMFGVSEGTSGGIDTAVAIDKYRPLADVMEKALGKQVVISFVRSFDALEAGMKKGEFDLVMARPSDYPARGVRDYGYTLVANSKPDGQCLFIVEKSSPLKTVNEIKGRNIIFPEKIAYMSKFCTAELRDKGINVATEKITYAKEQGAVGWSVENKLSEVGGVASYSGVAKNWEKGGQRVLHKSVPQPYSPLIAGKRIPADKLAKLKNALAELDKTDAGKKVLATIGIQGFNPESSERLLALLAWLEKS